MQGNGAGPSNTGSYLKDGAGHNIVLLAIGALVEGDDEVFLGGIPAQLLHVRAAVAVVPRVHADKAEYFQFKARGSALGPQVVLRDDKQRVRVVCSVQFLKQPSEHARQLQCTKHPVLWHRVGSKVEH